MVGTEEFETWKKQTLEQLNIIEKRIDMLYKRLSVQFDETILAVLWQNHLSYKQLKEVYENGVALFNVEKDFENGDQ